VTVAETGANLANVAGLPLIDAVGLTQAQLEGGACVSCQKQLPRPTVPVGRLVTGGVLYRCLECRVSLEPIEPGPPIPSTQTESKRPR
jgi:hypothetical protein